MPFKTIVTRTTPRAKTIRGPLEVRFWAKVDKRGPNECWPWLGAITRYGYGKFSISTGKACTATRVAYQLTLGEIPEGMFILHRCDNPACVNPNHLFIGTANDNMADQRAKCRHWRKLTPDQVEFVRASHLVIPQKKLAAMLGVSLPLIQKIQYRTSRING